MLNTCDCNSAQCRIVTSSSLCCRASAHDQKNDQVDDCLSLLRKVMHALLAQQLMVFYAMPSWCTLGSELVEHSQYCAILDMSGRDLDVRPEAVIWQLDHCGRVEVTFNVAQGLHCKQGPGESL